MCKTQKCLPVGCSGGQPKNKGWNLWGILLFNVKNNFIPLYKAIFRIKQVIKTGIWQMISPINSYTTKYGMHNQRFLHSIYMFLS